MQRIALEHFAGFSVYIRQRGKYKEVITMKKLIAAALCLALAGFRRLGWERYAAPGALLCLAAFTAAFLPKMTDGACLSWNAW